MNKLFPPWSIDPVLALLWGALCFYGGHQYSDNAWQARQAQQVRAQAQALQAEQVRSHAAALQAAKELQAQRKSYADLKEKFDVFQRRGPLVVWRAGAAAGVCGGGVPGGAVAPQQPDEAPAGVPAAGAGVAVGTLALSGGSVWLWNSTLAGTDTPAGACGAADPAHPACSLDAGVTLEVAWENHMINAQTWAEDRLRHQRLIDYVTAEQGVK